MLIFPALKTAKKRKQLKPKKIALLIIFFCKQSSVPLQSQSIFIIWFI